MIARDVNSTAGVSSAGKRFLCIGCNCSPRDLDIYSDLLTNHFSDAKCDLVGLDHFIEQGGILADYDAVVIVCKACTERCISLIHKLKQDFQHLPITLVSIKATEAQLIKAFRLGLDDYLSGRAQTLWRLPYKIEKLIEHNELMRRLRGERDFSTNLIENANAMIVAIDFCGKVLLFNKKIEKVSGYKRDEVLGKNLIDIFIPVEERDGLQKIVLNYKDGGSIPLQDSKYRLITKDGRTLMTSWNANVLRNYNGETIGLIGIGHDITAVKRLEERLVVSEKLRTIGELASGVAHHFNNLLGVVLGRTELLLIKTKDRPDLFHDLELIRRTSLDGAKIVKRIQNFARPSHSPDLEPLQMNNIILEVIEMTEPKLSRERAEGGRRIIIESRLNPLPITTGNAAELKEVFTNLVLNAMDAMPEGGTISISTEEKNGFILASCRDNGIGIKPEIINNIFDPFFTTKGSRGNGLGLSIAYDTIRRHNGEISVKSHLGAGTQFLIRIPILTPAIDTFPRLKRSSSMSKRVLLIDDEEDYRDSTAELLRLMGHDVVTAQSGEEALTAISRVAGFDVVLSDISMPDMDGWEVIKKIKSLKKNTKIIVISGHGTVFDTPEHNGFTVDRFLSKPCSVEEVDKAIKEVMNQ